jgi:hypothetical protein
MYELTILIKIFTYSILIGLFGGLLQKAVTRGG